MSKIIYSEVVNGQDVIRSWTAVPGTEGTVVKTKPGVGKAFWCWASVPAGTIIGVDMSGAPVATAVASQNQAAIGQITATPEEKLVYAEEE